MKYLENLEKRIGKNKPTDIAIYQLLSCEIVRINTILEDASYMSDTDKRDRTYEYEKNYKNKVLDLLFKIESGEI